MEEDSHEFDHLNSAESHHGPKQSMSGAGLDINTEKQLGIPSKATAISLLDISAVITSLTALAIAALVIYDKSIATSLGLFYQLTSFGLLLSIQGFCTSRQVLLSATFFLVHSRRATIQDLDSLSRNSIFGEKSSWLVRLTLSALAGLGPLLGILYKPFFVGSTQSTIPSITGQFGIIPPPHLDNLQGNGIALAVNMMTPFWQSRGNDLVYNTTYGENMFIINENATAILDLPMPNTFQDLRNLLSSDFHRKQSLELSTDVNATVSSKVDIPSEEMHLLAETIDHLPCEPSPFFWCANLGPYGTRAGMLLGGANSRRFPPAASSTVAYLGIWNASQGLNFSNVAQKIVLTRQKAHGLWHIGASALRLQNAYVKSNSSGAGSQFPIAIAPLGLGLLGQLLQEYNYQWYDHHHTRSIASLMASITWARIATLVTQDPKHNNHEDSWYASVSYSKLSDEYLLRCESQTVTHSIWLVLIFVVQPVIVITATILKAYVHHVPVSDGFGVISLLSSTSQDSLAILGGAGYSGKLSKVLRIWFSIDPTERSDGTRGKVFMRLTDSDEAESIPSGKVETLQKYG